MNIYQNENILKIEYNDNSYFIKWYLNNWCNFHCPYCNQWNKDNLREPQDTIELYATNLNRILLNNNVDKPLFIRFLGGECTIYDIIGILQKITVPIGTVGITTNFSRDNSYFKDLYNYCFARGIKLILTCSYHAEHKNFFPKMVELSYWCKEHHYRVPQVTFVVTKKDDLLLIDKCKELGLYNIKPMLQRGKGNRVVELEDLDKIKEYLKTNSNTNVGPYKIIFKDGTIEYRSNMSDLINKLDKGGFIADGRYCSAGLNSIIIKPLGEIYRSSCNFLRDADKKIGLLSDENLILPTEHVLCKVSQHMGWSSRCSLCNHNSISEVVDNELYQKELLTEY